MIDKAKPTLLQKEYLNSNQLQYYFDLNNFATCRKFMN